MIKPKFKVKSIDNGLKEYLAKMKADARGRHVEIGVFDNVIHVDSALGVVDIAAIHEFGLGVPERSFLRAWVDENQKRINDAIVRLFESVAKGKRTRYEALEILGQWAVGEIQKRIAAGILPELEQETIQRKGSSTPLVDTGQLRSSITYKVRM